MRRDLQVTLLRRLLGFVEARSTQLGDEEGRVPVDTYTSPARLDDEVRVLFRRQPLALAHLSELPEPGDFVTRDIAGLPLLVVRGDDGRARVFRNVCRHRGTRLADEPRGSRRRGFVCRYHAWAYDLRGSLVHVPQPESFPSVKCGELGLSEVPSATAAGFVWAAPGAPPNAPPPDLDAFLGPLADDFASFGLDRHLALRVVEARPACNWKLVIDAFTEGYHVRSLHRQSIARFFLETGAAFDALGPHSRTLGARREAAALRERPEAEWDVRAAATVFYYVFPNSVFVFHPDWVSHLCMAPEGAGRSSYRHTMLIPRAPEGEADTAHWAKTFDLIENQVFQREDLAMAETIQTGLGAGADTHFRVGRLEHPLLLFHRALDRAIADAPP
jgi:phenylpropionate dioxygenase-like ring-hydroxylating dioxygenase large terminal subunit